MGLSDVVGQLLPALHETTPSGLLRTLRRLLGEGLGATDVQVYLVDYDLSVLRELSDAATDARVSVSVDASDAGSAFVDQEPVVRSAEAASVVHVPVSTRGERIGVLVVRTPAPVGEPELAVLAQVAIELAHVLPRMSLYSDEVERARRVVPLTLPAEIQWAALPLRAYRGDQFDVAGQLCPAYEVGGDLFDYSTDGEHLQVCALDAMGHGLGASMLGSLAINALRNNRRAGLSLVDQVRGADRVLYGRYGGDQFVCGAFLRLHTRLGEAAVVNAGHPFGPLVRGSDASMLKVQAQLPMGLFEKTIYEEQRLRFEPGDRLVLVSDGALEAAPLGGDEYGEERLCKTLLGLRHLSADESVRRLVRELRGYAEDELRDDITVLVLDWWGP